MKMIIRPRKPILNKDYYCYIKLTKTQVDYGGLKMRVGAEGFREQTNRHITIIGGVPQDKIKNALSKLPSEKQKEIFNKLHNLLKKLKWTYAQDKVFLVSKKGRFGKKSDIVEFRKSYIRAISLPDIQFLYEKLNGLLNTNIPTQFPHITLFTKGERPNAEHFGIPIPSKAEFKRLHPVKIEE